MEECPARLRGKPHDIDTYVSRNGTVNLVCRACGEKRSGKHTAWNLIPKRWPSFPVYPQPIQFGWPNHEPAGPGYHLLARPLGTEFVTQKEMEDLREVLLREWNRYFKERDGRREVTPEG